MAECARTLDGKHHWAFRPHRVGEWPRRGSYRRRWECACTKPAPPKLIPKLERLEAEAERINELVLCAEPGEQGRLPL